MKLTSACSPTTARGGQASLGTFGFGSFSSPREAFPQLPKASRIKGALHSFSSDGLTPSHYRRPVAPVAKVQPVHAIRRPSLDDEPALAHSQWLADLAEAYGCPFDEEAAAYARSFAGVGMAEHLMALEG